MSECEIISADEIPPGRYYRFLEINQLEIGQAVFVPDDVVGLQTADPANLMTSHAYYRGLRLGRKFKTQRGYYKARRGTFVSRVA